MHAFECLLLFLFLYRFPAEIVAVDVSGRRFDRMSVQRRSLLHTETTYVEEDEGGSTVRRRTRTRKPRGKRRNTLAGTDQKEIVDALAAGYDQFYYTFKLIINIHVEICIICYECIRIALAEMPIYSVYYM